MADRGRLCMHIRYGDKIRIKAAEGDIDVEFISGGRERVRVAIEAPKVVPIERPDYPAKDGSRVTGTKVHS